LAFLWRHDAIGRAAGAKVVEAGDVAASVAGPVSSVAIAVVVPQDLFPAAAVEIAYSGDRIGGAAIAEIVKAGNIAVAATNPPST
jgi:hypothetical protein